MCSKESVREYVASNYFFNSIKGEGNLNFDLKMPPKRKLFQREKWVCKMPH